MSSCGNPNVEADALMDRKPKFDRSKVCVKCKTNPGHIVIRHAVYCRDCFFPLVTSKFRKVLTPVINENAAPGLRIRSLRAAGNLTVGFSGGSASTVLLDLVAQNYLQLDSEASTKGGKDHPRKYEVIWPEANLCYVEISNAFQGMRDRTEEIRQVVNKYDAFKFVPLRIEDAFDPDWWSKFGYRPLASELELGLSCDTTTDDIFVSHSQSSSNSTPVSRLRAFLSSLPTQTAILSSVQAIVRVLLLSMARATGSSHLVLGTTLSSLSISLISGIAQGGGFTVREEVQEEWSPAAVEGDQSGVRKGSVRVVRPLRDIGIKECAAWAWWAKLKVVGREKIPHANQGIGALTKDFIVGLERDYPSTVSTIARTCGKLAPKDTSRLRCVLCQRPAQPGVQEWKSRISLRSFTETADHIQLLADAESKPARLALAPALCYACHTTLTSRSSRGVAANQRNDASLNQTSVPLPVWIAPFLKDFTRHDHVDGSSSDVVSSGEEVFRSRKLTTDDMRKEIGEFLIEEQAM
ncbi:hypothetical protein HGRIS_003467 [Hohenbuehelia grisea]|uniref:Cytoplasmic tRNA 2-thiolation protein 2 n=1 Tax=Hohenbuehelia grisea TaxID=104357 RepID=A0ABR3JFK2_9AGAR